MKGMNSLRIFVKRNSPTILTCVGSIGVIATAVVAVRATPKALKLLEKATDEKGEDLTKWETIQVAGPTYIPSALICLSTIVCIFGANSLNRKQQAALVSAYTLLSNAYTEYRNKVIEVYGEEAEAKIREAILKDRQDHIYPEGENDLFYEQFSGRYFEAPMERVLKAECDFNKKLALNGSASLNELYGFLGLEKTEGGDVIGWSTSIGESIFGYSHIDFDHELVIMDDGLECYIIDASFVPTADYIYWSRNSQGI